MPGKRAKDWVHGTPGEASQTHEPAEEETSDSLSGAEKAAIGPEILSWPDEEEDPGANADGDTGGGEMDGPDGGDCEVPG